MQMALTVGETVCRKNGRAEGSPHRSIQQGMKNAKQGMQCTNK